MNNHTRARTVLRDRLFQDSRKIQIMEESKKELVRLGIMLAIAERRLSRRLCKPIEDIRQNLEEEARDYLVVFENYYFDEDECFVYGQNVRTDAARNEIRQKLKFAIAKNRLMEVQSYPQHDSILAEAETYLSAFAPYLDQPSQEEGGIHSAAK